ncbi:MAG: hypothetical protein IK090_02035 [Clostridia bacterium]|nr:hypothetical protein [Clostridia bacterium]
MRLLKITRRKSFVASLAKMKVWIEDPAGDLMIGGVPCRLLGKLKNGEEGIFEIGEEAARIFVIGDKLSRGFCNDFYEIPAGSTEVVLSGANRFNPATGNAFRFDGSVSEEVVANRKKGMKRGLIVLLCCLIVGFAIGFAIGGPAIRAARNKAPKTFSGGGITITLTKAFDKKQINTSPFCAASRDVVLLANKEDLSKTEYAGITTEEYGDLWIRYVAKMEGSTTIRDGLPTFAYEKTVNNTPTTYFCVFLKSGNVYWVLQFATATKRAESSRSQFLSWAKTASFN